MTQRCETCRFWDDGYCARFPPVPRIGWPKVPKHLWCGEWQAKPEIDTDEYRDAYSRMMAHGS